MERRATSVGAAALALAALWIAVYWWTPAPPAPPAQLSFGRTPDPAPGPLDQPARAPGVEAPSGPTPGPRAADDGIERLVPRGAVTPPSFLEHTVEPGDSAEEISARYYGTSRHWRSVMNANPMVDFTRLRAGQVLRIAKDPANIQGLVEGDTGSGLEADGRLEMEYTVRPGDTLSEIAQRIYGRSALWTVIRDANLDLVGADGRRMRPGQVLTIPPAPG